MKLKLIAVGHKMPGWIQAGFDEYAKRMPRECRIDLIELAPSHRPNKPSDADINKAMADESARMLAKVDAADHVVALDERGKSFSSQKLAQAFDTWMLSGQNVALLIGGADGLHADCKARANQMWSLSAGTLPHALVRVILAEQLYRAWSIRAGHPYHRE